jgi:glycosyltransferase involved in cell wall biosynthesis
MARIVFAGREVWPFVEGGGIGRYVWTAATLLAPHHDVTILTTDAHRDLPRDRLPQGVALAFAAEPTGDVRPFSSSGQAWSAALLEAVRELAPDVVEFGDYSGEGFATVHARRGGDPRLRSTTVAVRVHTSGEMVAGLNEASASEATDLVWTLERFPIRHADALLWPGGDVLDRYRDFYGTVAEPLRLPLPVRLEDLQPEAGVSPPVDGPLRLLFLNRLEARKGVAELVEAVRGLPDVRLTLVGRDTDTAPGGGSMRTHLEALADERVEFRDQVPHEQVPALIAAHHAVAVPVRWETFSYVTREALAANRPVLATAVGAIPDVVRADESGWLAEAGVEGLRAALAGIDRAAAEKLIASGGPRAALEASLSSAEEQAAAYAELAARAAPEPAAAETIDAVVSLHAGDAGLERTLRSLHAQRGVKVRVTLSAGDDALPAAHLLLAADSLGDAAGAELVLHLPAGAELDPEFARRAVAAIGGFDSVTAFTARGRKPWHAPLGTEDPPVVLRRHTPQGLDGLVIQEPLVRRLPRRRPAAPATLSAST